MSEPKRKIVIQSDGGDIKLLTTEDLHKFDTVWIRDRKTKREYAVSIRFRDYHIHENTWYYYAEVINKKRKNEEKES